LEAQADRTGAGSGEGAVVFFLAAALPIYLALRSGGYDIVVRQEAALAVWIAIALGLSFGLLPRALPPRVALVPLGALAALAALTALALIATPSAERTVGELARVLGYAGFVTLAWLGLGPRTWSAACAGLAAAAVAITALAVTSRLAPTAFPDSPLADLLGSDRLFYPLGYWNAVAAWAAMAAVAALAWSLQGRVRWTGAAALGSVPVCVLAVYLTYSRGGFLAIAVGTAAVLLLSRNRLRAAAHVGIAAVASLAPILVARGQPEIANGTGAAGGTEVILALIACVAACALAVRATRRIGSADPDPRRRARITTRLVLAAIGVVAAIGLATGAAYRAWDEFTGDEPVAAAAAADPGERLTSAAGYRYAYWGAAIDAFASDPPGGVGPGTFEYWWRTEGSRPERVRDAHSVFLEQLAELGLPGFACVLALFGGALWAGLRPHPAHRRPAAALAMAGVFCAFTAAAAIDWVWEFSALTVLALLAITAAGAAGSAPPSRSRERRARRFPPRRRLALVIVALGAAAAQVPGLVSAQLVRGSAESLAAGDLDEALSRADDAVLAAPWEASPYALRARIQARLGDLDAAAADAATAVSHEPLEPSHRQLDARLAD
jgi:hypothetical protein